ncbi:Protein LOW PSII ACCUMULATION 3 [Hibiscus syriacus]|uniref:Protein LOW PSII ACCUMULATION 3 n=1 Tax=Hibiscus syriacus TaxID=106335 RepID=A0A6A3B5J1_HIBSY|nr:Protein LOW PSII ACCUMULATION 3 [Hibiscus syriacus]
MPLTLLLMLFKMAKPVSRLISHDFIDANIQLALAVVRKLQQKMETRARIVDGISIGSLDDVPSAAVTTFFKSIKNTLDFDFEDENEGRREPKEPPTLYIFINCSTRELSAIEKYVVRFLYFLDLLLIGAAYVCSADLGLLGFPPKDLHYQFLSRFIPVFYIRIREYSKTVAVAPFVVNYGGALFRQYPDVQTKEELLRVLGLQEEQGRQLEFLRRGYKTSTWWEEDVEVEVYSAWHS